MKAEVKIQKSFDASGKFSKEWEKNDFREFFDEEGEYLDRLCDTVQTRGKTGEGFTVTYTITVTK